MKKYAMLLLTLAIAGMASGQQKVGYIDSEFIYGKFPEFASAQQTLDRMAQQMEQDIADRQRDLNDLFQEYEARELLYTRDERQRRREEIMREEEDLERLRAQYFGPEGELYRQQEQILRPIQEKILIAVEEVAEAEEYDYVFDKGGDLLFLYATDRHDLSEQVLEVLGIEVQPGERERAGSN